MSTLSSLIEITTVVLDTTMKLVTIPDKTKSLVVVPQDIDVYFASDISDIASISGTIPLSLSTEDKVLPIKLVSDILKIKLNDDIANRTFYLSSLSSGTAKILYEKHL
jgi:hypothetical protein